MLGGRRLVTLMMCAAAATPAAAGQVEVQHVTAKMAAANYLPVSSEAEAIKQYGEQFGKQLWQTAQASMRPSYHVFLLNRDTESKVTRVELQLRFLDGGGTLIEERAEGVQLEIPPGGSMEHIVWCADPACEASESLQVTVLDATLVNLRPKVVLAGNEFPFEWNGSTWYLEDLWAEERTLVVRGFAAGAYKERPFDGRVFTAGSLEADPERFSRVAGAPIKARWVSGDELELEPYQDGPMWYSGGLPGLKIEDGLSVKPGLLELGTTKVRAETADGEVVVYGDLRLIFADGRLAGCERKNPS